MILQEIAWIASAFSLVVATATFVFNVIDRTARDRRDEILKWQRTIIYSIIQSGASTFEDIKMKYLLAAQQVIDLAVPKKEIQDGALQLVLLSLIESGLIAATTDGEYLRTAVEATSERSMKEQMNEVAYKMFVSKEAEKKAISKIYEIIETQPGIYTIDSLHRYLRERQFDIDFETLNLAVRAMLSRREIFMWNNQKLYSRPQAPPPQPAAVGSAKPSEPTKP